MDKNQPVKTLPKPKPNLVTKKIEVKGFKKDKQNMKGRQVKEIKNKSVKTVKHLDHLFTKEFRF
tara:strand:+ start:338 stop:529 length:192 start_codon:yes stop_codon:yes gene_type:complete